MDCSAYDIDSPTAASFEMMYPAFASDVRVPLLIDEAKSTLSFSCLCKVWNRAVFLFVAHHLVLAQASGLAGSTQPNSTNLGLYIAQHSVDGVTTTFARVKPYLVENADGTTTTLFDQQLQRLIRVNSPTGGIFNTAFARMGV